MPISDFLAKHAVLPALGAPPKDTVLALLADTLAAGDPHLDAGEVRLALLNRERISSTAVGDGVAVPHARLAGLARTVAVFARSAPGIEFAAHDGRPTHLLFAVVTPAESTDHLKVLSRAARLLSDGAFRSRLMGAQDADELFALLCDRDRQTHRGGAPATSGGFVDRVAHRATR